MGFRRGPEGGGKAMPPGVRGVVGVSCCGEGQGKPLQVAAAWEEVLSESLMSRSPTHLHVVLFWG